MVTDKSGEARTAITADVGRVQDRLANVWAALVPVKREDLPNAKLWADLIAIKTRMVFLQSGGAKAEQDEGVAVFDAR